MKNQCDSGQDAVIVRVETDAGITALGGVIHAMSGIDLALWDIKGEALRLPVWKLLGGGFHKNIWCCASNLFRATPGRTEEIARR